MANNLDVVVFKNRLINNLTGQNTTLSYIYFMQFFSGAKPATPQAAPAGAALTAAFVWAGGRHTQASLGIAALSSPVAITPNASGTAGFCRLTDAGSQQFADFDCGVTGSGLEVVISTTSLVNGTPFNVTNFSWRMPSSLGSLKLNSDLVNAITNSWLQNTGVTAAAMGVSGTIDIYSGAAPATADAPLTGTKLATFTTASGVGSWQTASAGSAALITNLSTTGLATGTAGYAVWKKGTYIIIGSVGTSAADFILDTLSITSGGTVQLTDATITY